MRGDLLLSECFLELLQPILQGGYHFPSTGQFTFAFCGGANTLGQLSVAALLVPSWYRPLELCNILSTLMHPPCTHIFASWHDIGHMPVLMLVAASSAELAKGITMTLDQMMNTPTGSEVHKRTRGEGTDLRR